MAANGNRALRFLGVFRRNKLASLAAVILLLMAVMAVFAPIIAPHDPVAVNVTNSLKGISTEHILGTDVQGRDVFSRVVFGARSTLLGALMIVLISTVVGVTVGMVSGYMGGTWDNLLMRTLDVILSFPSLLLAFVVVAAFGRGLLNNIIVLSIVYIPLMARVVRSVTLVQKSSTYVEAAWTLHYSSARIIFRHILPNCVPVIIVQATTNMAYSLLDIAAMSFLGLGVTPPTPDWGMMLSEGKEYLMIAPKTCIAAGLAIMIAVICFNLLGDGLQEYYDPKQQQS